MSKILKNLFKFIPYIFLLVSFILIISLTYSIKNNQVPTIFGRAILRVTTGSMEPTLMVGDIIFVDTTVDPEELVEGQIIVFHVDFNNDGLDEVVVHYLDSTPEQNGTIYYRTHGENSPTDPWELENSDIIGLYMAKSPLIGQVYTLLFGNGLTTIFIIIISVFLVIGGMELFNIIKQYSLEKEKLLLEEKEKMIQEELEKLRNQEEKEE